MSREPPNLAVVHESLPHDSAALHVTGQATYIDDIPEPQGTLHIALGLAPRARGTIRTLDLSAVQAAEGVVRVITGADVPGKNDSSPHLGDEPMLATDEIAFHNQAIFAVVATTRKAARLAARLGRIEIEAETPSVSVADARMAGGRVLPDYAWENGQVATALAEAQHRLVGEIEIGGQEHFYLEGQVAFALPGEGDEMFVHSSTQHPSEVQHIVARVLGVADHNVTVECRRMGGGFGGKESQASQFAAIAAVAAKLTKSPCKLRLDRDDDFVLTGKRHDFRSAYQVGFDDEGQIKALDLALDARCGYSADLTLGVVDRAMFHSDNAYFLPEVQISTRRLKTNTVSNTAFRGFGGPQGMLATECILDAIAHQLGRDPLDVRKANFSAASGGAARNHQRISRAPGRDCRVQRGFADPEKGDRPHPGQVRNFLHAQAPQSGRRAGACLFRWVGEPQSRRHRDGARALRQGRADRGRCIRPAA
jgi:xanthine dehydrogenase large subunit